MAPRDVGLTVGKISKVLLWAVYVWVVLNLVLLFLAFLLRLFGANPEAGFTEWVYRGVQRSMAPFRGIFEPIVLTDESVLDTSLLFAMIIYGLVALFLRAGIDWITERLSKREQRLEHERWALQSAGLGATTPSAASTAPGPGPYAGPASAVPARPVTPGQPPLPPPR
jgi:uncharacterized protein YggT (Ycf19 family)